ncbi:MAG: helix-turn-helix domain-containing protein [Magnetococcus sp. MYC-9]
MFAVLMGIKIFQTVKFVKRIFYRMVEIFERLRAERKRLGMNQTDFAEKGGVGLGSQVRYESGERLPDAGYLAAIAGLGADVTYILTGVRTLTGEKAGRGLPGYPEVGAEEVLEAVEQLADLMISTGTTVPPEKLADSVRLAVQILADEARKQKSAADVVDLSKIRQLIKCTRHVHPKCTTPAASFARL